MSRISTIMPNTLSYRLAIVLYALNLHALRRFHNYQIPHCINCKTQRDWTSVWHVIKNNLWIQTGCTRIANLWLHGWATQGSLEIRSLNHGIINMIFLNNRSIIIMFIVQGLLRVLGTSADVMLSNKQTLCFYNIWKYNYAVSCPVCIK